VIFAVIVTLAMHLHSVHYLRIAKCQSEVAVSFRSMSVSQRSGLDRNRFIGELERDCGLLKTSAYIV